MIDPELPSDVSLCLTLQDYLTIGTTTPRLDANQDWKLTYSSEYNGVTKLRFYRKLNTNEQGDVVIQVKNSQEYIYKCYECLWLCAPCLAFKIIGHSAELYKRYKF